MFFSSWARLAKARIYDLQGRIARRPVAFAILCTTTKAATCDVIAQRHVEGRESLNLTRISVFASFGFVYCGAMQYYIYSVAYPWGVACLSLRRGPGVLASLAVDLVCHYPLIYFPTFYCIQDVVVALDQGRNVALAKACAVWWNNMKDDMAACCAFWLPMNAFNFYFMPIHLRVPFIASAGFGWLVILSAMRGAVDE